MAGPKTRPTGASVSRFLNAIRDDRLRADCRTVAGIMKRATNARPKLYGSSIVGFGTRTITYAGGRVGEWPRVAFAPRAGKFTLYISSGFDGYRGLRARLGKHTGGKSCIHIKSLSDIHLPTLRKLVGDSVKQFDRRS